MNEPEGRPVGVQDHKGPSSPSWAFMNGFQVRKRDTPYLDRLRIVQTPWFGLFLHRIHQPDRDRDPHDHPWPFISVILSGGYTESVWSGQGKRHGPTWKVHARRRWSVHRMPVHRAHMITSIDGQLWTLVITGRRCKSWGFWTADGFVPWRQYLGGDVVRTEDAAIWGGRD